MDASLKDGGLAKRQSGLKIAPKRARLSPINQRRLVNFRANRRGYWSFWIFLSCFVISLFS
ncbi:MAG TPA: ABC transporter permease, partial [Methylocella sp.]|nr:ABC transporter permease [Methylocella sp.]